MSHFHSHSAARLHSQTRARRGAAAISIAIVLSIAGLSLVGCPDNTGGGTGDGNVVDTTAPAQVTGLAQTRSVDSTSVTLSWTNPADDDLETVRIAVDPAISGFPLDISASGASMSQSQTATGVEPATDYTFTIRTVDATGNVSASSGAPTVTASHDTTAPAQVTNPAAVASAKSVTLSWENPADADLSYIRIAWTPATSGPAQPIETARATTPATVATTQRILNLDANTAHTFTIIAVDTAGNVSDTSGDSPSTSMADATTGTAGFRAIGAGVAHTCALRAESVYCWGSKENGRVGDGTATGQEDTPQRISNVAGGFGGATLADVSALSVGSSHTCAIAGANDAAYCWGDAANGRLGGNRTDPDETVPVAVRLGAATGRAIFTGVSAIAAGGSHTCAIAGAERTAYCWGNGDDGRLGNGTISGDALVPAPVLSGAARSGAALTGVSAISAGGSHTCAIAGTERTAYCWGGRADGRLGNGTTSGTQTTPVAVTTLVVGTTTTALTGVTAIFAGAEHSCAIANGTPYCWGRGGNERLGSNSAADRNRPVLVVATTETEPPPPTSGADGRAPLAAAMSFGSGLAPSRSCAVAGTTNIAYCWGAGSDALGIGASTADQPRPAAVQGVGASGMPNGMLSGIVAIATGSTHTCAISPTAAYCWGDDTNGQLGNGAETASQSTPVDITTNF